MIDEVPDALLQLQRMVNNAVLTYQGGHRHPTYAGVLAFHAQTALDALTGNPPDAVPPTLKVIK